MRRRGWAILGALVALVAFLLTIDAAAGAGSGGGLFYAPLTHDPVPDACSPPFAPPDCGPGVTRDSRFCPDSHPTPTAGGIQLDGDQSSLDLELKSSGPELGVGGWNYQANNSTGSDGGMTLSLVCAKGPFEFRIKTKQIPPGDQATRTATCPAGTELAGGGTKTGAQGDHRTEVASSGPTGGDSWEGTENNTSAVDVHMSVVAVCAERGSYRIVRSDARLPDNSQVSDGVRCPRGTRLSGGGVRTTGLDTGLEVANSFPFDNGDRRNAYDNGWKGSANNQNTGQTQTMRTFAICKRT